MATDEKLDFPATYESLFQKALASDVTPALKERLRALGLELDRPLLPGYPAALWPKVVRATTDALYPGVPFAEASRKLGHRFITAYFDTMMGKAVAMVMRTLGPKRSLERLERTLRSTNNYQRTKVTERGPQQMELWVAEVNGVSGWFQGMFDGVVEHLALKEGTSQLLSDDGVSATFLVSWK